MMKHVEYSSKSLNKKVLKRKLFFVKPGLRDISVLCSKMNIMIGAGIGISKVLLSIASQTQNKLLKNAVVEIKNDVVRGKSLYSSMSKFTEIFPDYMVEMIGVGEESGKLESVLGQLAEYYEKQYKIYSGIKAALAYPAFAFVISIVIITYLANSVIPQFINIMELQNVRIPAITEIYVNVFYIFHAYAVHIAFIGIVFLFAMLKFLKSASGKYLMEKIKNSIPYFGGIHRKILIFKIVSSMKIMNASGVNILKGIYITSKMIDNISIKSKFMNSIVLIKSGESIGSAFEKCNIGNKLFLYMIKTGEESGRLDFMLEKLETIFSQDLNRDFKIVLKMIEPTVIIILSLFIGVFIMSAVMPVFNIMDSIS